MGMAILDHAQLMFLTLGVRFRKFLGFIWGVSWMDLVHLMTGLTHLQWQFLGNCLATLHIVYSLFLVHMHSTQTNVNTNY